MRRLAVYSSAFIVLTFAGCGGGSSNSTPTTPTPTPNTPTQANRVPTVTNVTVSPAFGISSLTSFTYSASASDPDGDQVSYEWDLAGNAAVGASGNITLVGSGIGTFRLTVSDGKGGTSTDSRTITLGNATGTWRGTGVNLGPFTMVLTQNGPKVTGTYNDPLFGNGQIDPAQPGSINASGHIELRAKQAFFTDFTFKGDMDQSGRRITGQIFGSGFNGQAFTMDKQ